MQPLDASIIAFVDAEDTRAQRDAAFEILATLESFFDTEDLTEINDKLDDERLSNTQALDRQDAEDVEAYLRDMKDQADWALDCIQRSMDRSRSYR